jgi:hypothetical protein
MMLDLFILWLLSFVSLFISPIKKVESNPNVIVVTLDGLRWQEIFNGADSVILNDKTYDGDIDYIKTNFWATDVNKRRNLIAPFIWNTIAKQGVLIGNRNYDANFNVANKYQFSYPGYNEIFTGYPDDSVNTNDKILNKNLNVLEYINSVPKYKGKVATFSTWDVFPYILNKKRSGIYVNADVDTISFKDPTLSLLNEMQFVTSKPINVRPDLLTYFTAKEYLKAYHPNLLYISFDETDDFAHSGMYDQYLKSLHAEDAMISNLWNTIQSIPQYKNNTTLIITCDHGRGGTGKSTWKNHGQEVKESSQIWFAAMGPKIANVGEIKKPMQLYQKQIAATIAKLMDQDFNEKNAKHPVGEPLNFILK